MFLFDIKLRTSGDFWLSMLLLRCFSLEKDVSLILQSSRILDLKHFSSKHVTEMH